MTNQVDLPENRRIITNAAAKARVMDVIETAKKLGARHPDTISRDALKRSGDLYALFTYTDNPRGHVELHADLKTGMVFFYGSGLGRDGLVHEERDAKLAHWVADKVDAIRAARK